MKSYSADEPVEIHTLLHSKGLRATAPRIAVFRALKNHGGHHSVDDVLGILESEGEQVTRMSVYNVISDLATAGLVMCADTGPGRALYEVADEWHHHFVCRQCGAVIDVPCVEGVKPCLEAPVAFKGTIDEAQVIFRGVCADCLSQKSSGF